jgi:hypothetical protein
VVDREVVDVNDAVDATSGEDAGALGDLVAAELDLAAGLRLCGCGGDLMPPCS